MASIPLSELNIIFSKKYKDYNFLEHVFNNGFNYYENIYSEKNNKKVTCSLKIFGSDMYNPDFFIIKYRHETINKPSYDLFLVINLGKDDKRQYYSTSSVTLNSETYNSKSKLEKYIDETVNSKLTLSWVYNNDLEYNKAKNIILDSGIIFNNNKTFFHRIFLSNGKHKSGNAKTIFENIEKIEEFVFGVYE